MRHPHVLQLIMDSLRYWVLDMHVDGFRFDLAATLARQFYEVDRLSAFFDLVQQDPVVSQVKLVAEPWDLGEGGYQVGNFPVQWTEWNGKYRDTSATSGAASRTVTEFASRLTGSSDLYQQEAVTPSPASTSSPATTASRCAISSRTTTSTTTPTARTTATAADNRSWNCGVEGPTDDEAVHALRARQQRNFFATLLLSQGVPMMRGGDEIGHTQRGNNNAYCQDNEISWIDWSPRAEDDQALFNYVRKLIRLRADHAVFRRRRFFRGQALRGGLCRNRLGDIAWFTLAGEEMTDEDWDAGFAKSLTVFLNGRAISEPDRRGERVQDDSFLLLFNASENDLQFVIPPRRYGPRWTKILDTAITLAEVGDETPAKPGDAVTLVNYSMQLLRRG